MVNHRLLRTRLWKAGFFFGSVVLVTVVITRPNGLPFSRSGGIGSWSWPRARRDTYVGSRSCAACHPDEFALHSRSRHARTLRPVSGTTLASRLNGLALTDPQYPERLFRYNVRQGQLWVERRESGDVERLSIDYALGSGEHGISFVTLTDRTPNHPDAIEHRMSLFNHGETLDITVGQDVGKTEDGIVPMGRQLGSALTLKCFACHSTTNSDQGPLVLDEGTMIPDVGCERCHGPGRTHVEAAKRGSARVFLAMPFGLSRWKPGDEIRLCGSCHRLPANVDPEQIAHDDPWIVRFPPVGLMQSACFRMSPGALSCSSCHDPHARTSTDMAGYESVCLTCHRAPSQRSCTVSPGTGCIPCHMPRRDVLRGMIMTDHWIRSRRG